MQCPVCSNSRSYIATSRTTHNVTVRRRECALCKHRWTTKEEHHIDERMKEWSVQDKIKLVELREFGDDLTDAEIGDRLKKDHLIIAYKVEEMLESGEYFVYLDHVIKVLRTADMRG